MNTWLKRFNYYGYDYTIKITIVSPNSVSLEIEGSIFFERHFLNSEELFDFLPTIHKNFEFWADRQISIHCGLVGSQLYKLGYEKV